jgi:hypothetical protein
MSTERAKSGKIMEESRERMGKYRMSAYGKVKKNGENFVLSSFLPQMMMMI